MAEFQCTDRHGEVHQLTGKAGLSLMALMQMAGLPVGSCGGGASCGTCHIHVPAAWQASLPELTDEEDLLFDRLFDVTEDSRLSCQLMWADDLDGMQVTLVGK